MAFGRRRPSLARSVVRGAVISSAVTNSSGRAARKQAGLAAEEQAARDAAAAAAAPAAAGTDDVVAKLERLAALHSSGALSDEEFSQLKESLLA
jgi:hypothetical protein